MNENELFYYEMAIETLNLRSVRERLFPSGRRACRSSKVRDHETNMAHRNTAVHDAKVVKA